MPTAIYLPGDASGASNQWSVQPGGEIHAVAVADDDGDTSYVFRTLIQSGLDLWPYQDPTANQVPQVEGTRIDRVESFFICKSVSGGPFSTTRSALRLYGVNYTHSALMSWASPNYAQRSQVWATFPAVGNRAWRFEDFALGGGAFQQFGISKQATLGSIQQRATAAWVEVEWSNEPRRALRTRGRSITPVGVGRIAHG
jgi:hypothetical protein